MFVMMFPNNTNNAANSVTMRSYSINLVQNSLRILPTLDNEIFSRTKLIIALRIPTYII